MEVWKRELWDNVSAIRDRRPLVHNITNFVVMNSVANALLALGASPVMAHALEEVEEMASQSEALVLNIGTLEPAWVTGMLAAARAALNRGRPVVLDPVGAGATGYRSSAVQEILATGAVTVLRGNASEINSLAFSNSAPRGVDSVLTDDAAIPAVEELYQRLKKTVCASGAVDRVRGPKMRYDIANGSPMMERVTGFGCSASALIGAFLTVCSDPALATAQAMALMGLAGEMAAERSSGPGSLQTNFLDVLFNLEEKDLDRLLISESPQTT